jgi:hypothetical protein
MWCSVRVVVVVMILLAGGRRALDETETKYGSDSIKESWLEIGSFGAGGGGGEGEKKARS